MGAVLGRRGPAFLGDQLMITPKYPIGIAIHGQNGRKTRGNSHLRSARQRRRAFQKAQDALLIAAWKRWGHVDNVPPDVDAKLRVEVARLHQHYLGR